MSCMKRAKYVLRTLATVIAIVFIVSQCMSMSAAISGGDPNVICAIFVACIIFAGSALSWTEDWRTEP